MAEWAIGVVCALCSILVIIFINHTWTPYLKARRSIAEIERQLGEAAPEDRLKCLDEWTVDTRAPLPLRHALTQYLRTWAPTAQNGNHATGADSIVGDTQIAYLILNAELGRHLPGLATAVGIIGSFLGLTGGLGKYKPGDPDSVGPLIGEVKTAFYGSLGAIVVAVLLTLADKAMTNDLVNQLHRLSIALDGSIPVKPVEVQLLDKLDALGDGLERSHREIANATIVCREGIGRVDRTIRESTTTLLEDGFTRHSSTIRDGIVDVLGETLTEFKKALSSTTDTANDGVQQLLTKVLTDFQAQLESTFGNQIHSITASNVQATQTLESVRGALAELIGQVGATQARGAEALDETLRSAMRSVADDQAKLLEQVRMAVSELQASSEATAAKNASAGEAALIRMSDVMAKSMESMEQSLRAAQDSAAAAQADSLRTMAERQDAMSAQFAAATTQATETAQKSVSDTLAAVRTLQQSISDTVEQTARVVADLRKLQTDAFEKMNSGAAGVQSAFKHFEGSTASLTGAIEAFTPTLGRLTGAATALETATGAFSSVANRQSETQKSAEETARALTGAVGSAREISTRMGENAETIAGLLVQIRTISAEVTGHSQRISDAMQAGMDAFQESMTKQVDKVFTLAVSQLNLALGALSAAMNDMAAQLGDALEGDKE